MKGRGGGVTLFYRVVGEMLSEPFISAGINNFSVASIGTGE